MFLIMMHWFLLRSGRIAISAAGVLLWLCLLAHAAAAELHGVVTFGGLPVPGATVTVKQGAKTFSTATDQGGVYHFADVPDGQWALEVAMQCFRTIDAQVTVGANTPAGNWALTLLPIDQLLATTKLVQSPIAPQTELTEPPANANRMEILRRKCRSLPSEASQQSAMGFWCKGARITRRLRAIRPMGLSAIHAPAAELSTPVAWPQDDNSATDARPYSISGNRGCQEQLRSDHELGVYWRADQDSAPDAARTQFLCELRLDARQQRRAVQLGLVPTTAERMGNLAGSGERARPAGNDLQSCDWCGPTRNNQVPVSAQAAALLALYPCPNIANCRIGYNYQAPVLNSVHQDALQSRLNENAGPQRPAFRRIRVCRARARPT